MKKKLISESFQEIQEMSNEFQKIEDSILPSESQYYDVSNYKISSHALAQFLYKCQPLSSLIEVPKIIRLALKKVYILEQDKDAIKYTEGNYIFVVKDKTIVTVYPKERLFVAKPLYKNKQVGYKWM